MIGISTGVLESGFQMLGMIGRYQMTFQKISEAFPTVGVIPVEATLEIAQGLNWIQANANGVVALTAAGQNTVSLPGYPQRLRRALLDYVESQRPPWLQNAIYGRKRVLSFLSPEVHQIFREAFVHEGANEDVVKFWSDLAARARGQRADKLTEIGRGGEKLTLKYEKRRTNREPKWISLESNEDGYDVLSIVDRADSRLLRIEVKATTQGKSGTIHITRNEWQTALDNDTYTFHIWDLIAEEIAVVSPDDLRGHIPVEQRDGKWETVVIPIRVVDHLFSKRCV
ncbi:DUF3883 domain-containing protein [SAR202 cluster bacterium AD-804-J14_MRT_500m]|nr:DUF3883 domain-containing protein [SAR202 cluster bacterium AD-804-J14_MRT_500m]